MRKSQRHRAVATLRYPAGRKPRSGIDTGRRINPDSFCGVNHRRLTAALEANAAIITHAWSLYGSAARHGFVAVKQINVPAKPNRYLIQLAQKESRRV